jgi:hypothetical protein
MAYNTAPVYIAPLAATLATHGVTQPCIVPTPGMIVPVEDITDGKKYDANDDRPAPIYNNYTVCFILRIF